MTMKNKMPVLFIGHGSPQNIILDNSFTRSLAALGKRLPMPKAILVISAHWLTKGTFVGCTKQPDTIYDFFGFPEELYDQVYPCPGAPGEAALVTDTLKKAAATCDHRRGLDHGAWAILRHLYPHADIPVFQLSLDYTFNDWDPKPLQYHYDLAARLSALRSRGILIIGSGNIVHNLGMFDFTNIDAKSFDWAVEFDEKVRTHLISRNHQDLIHYRNMGEAAALAVPTLDHYLPMIYAISLQEKNESPAFIYEGFQYGSISMRCFQIG
jgi:4,5-DOPA dioxygenase extradiol